MEEDAKKWVISAVGNGPAQMLIPLLQEAGYCSVEILEGAKEARLQAAGVPGPWIDRIIEMKGLSGMGCIQSCMPFASHSKCPGSTLCHGQ
jgi:hypothetical protein